MAYLVCPELRETLAGQDNLEYQASRETEDKMDSLVCQDSQVWMGRRAILEGQAYLDWMGFQERRAFQDLLGPLGPLVRRVSPACQDKVGVPV
jgi:hypothetical protein